MLENEIIFTGVQVNYYFICHRKLWLFSHGIQMEKESDAVEMGKILHESSYRKEKEIMMERIAIDFVERSGKIIVHEVKKSRKMEKAHIYQVLYYIYSLKEKGVEAEGVINYPLLRKTERIELHDEEKIKGLLHQIEKIVSMVEPPPARRKPYCKRCAYYEFCWSE